MLQLVNESPFEAFFTVLTDVRARDVVVVAVKATFELGDEPVLSARQVPVTLVDSYRGDPGASSLEAASDMLLPKPGTDVLVVGSAHSHRGPVTELEVSVKVGELRKRVNVVGDRLVERGLLTLGSTAPKPFEAMPLIFERAFGGTHVVDAAKGKVLAAERNPVGAGYAGKRAAKDLEGTPLPNLTHPSDDVAKPGNRHTPACFAPVAPSWSPRVELAGTYDEAWSSERAPFLPADFDPRFFHVAAPELISAEPLVGGEPVELTGLSPRGPLAFELPSDSPRVVVETSKGAEVPEPALETVVFEPDEGRFTMTWKACVDCDKRTLGVREVRVEGGGS